MHHTISFIRKVNESPDVVSFYFSKPQDYTFLAGQYAKIFFGEDIRNKALSRSMSFSSAPQDSELRFTMHTNSGSEFKTQILALNPGDTINISPAHGEFVYPKTPQKRIYWLAGGVGITPFISMLRDKSLSDANELNAIALFHISSGEFVVSKEYQDLPITYKQASFQEMEGDLAHAKNHLVDSKGLFYISGSPRFVMGVRKILLGFGIPKSDIKLDTFVGY